MRTHSWYDAAVLVGVHVCALRYVAVAAACLFGCDRSVVTLQRRERTVCCPLRARPTVRLPYCLLGRIQLTRVIDGVG